MAKKLVIVESPAKARTINKILGKDYTVKSSMGHVRDLPVKTLGVDLDNGFEPSYVTVKGRKKVIDETKKWLKEKDQTPSKEQEEWWKDLMKVKIIPPTIGIKEEITFDSNGHSYRYLPIFPQEVELNPIEPAPTAELAQEPGSEPRIEEKTSEGKLQPAQA